MPLDPLLLAPAFLLGALLYASVGHGGASAYLAIMALAQVVPESMRPMALALNLVVAGVAAIQYARAGHLQWSLLWPFVVASVPMAYLGGLIDLPEAVYRTIIGLVLAYAALVLWQGARRPDEAPTRAPSLGIALTAGAVLGGVSGLTGVGGGIFLSPLLMLMGWARAKPTAAASAVFIWLNSLAGLAAQVDRLPLILDDLAWAAPAVLIGGTIGAWIGARRAAPQGLRRLLAMVLVIAAAKMLSIWL
jgi:uncharacterized membrane protein YfcA